MSKSGTKSAGFINSNWALILLAAIALIAMVIAFYLAFPSDVACENPNLADEQRYQLDRGIQTSGVYLHNLAKWRSCSNPSDQRAQEIYEIVSDIDIESRSYAMMNKIAFVLALPTALALILIPVLHSFLGDSVQHKKWKKAFSPSQFPAITLLAAFIFSMYSDYKTKQGATENLMRYALYTQDPIPVISESVVARLTTLDTGFEFSEYVSGTPEEVGE